VDSSDFAQYINYSYNERGWLRTSGAYLFSMTLDYNSGPGPQYNGNISSQLWGTFFNENNRFNYTYDRLNRLVSGITTDGNFMERGISYDVMGNITKLSRVFKGVLIDSLSYNYLSGTNATNQLQSITDYSPDNGITGYKAGSYVYTYDANGNMITDNSKGIAIAYNLLNLPQTVTGNKTITYTYDANGQKLRRVSSGTGTTDYINGIQYDQTTGAETLTFIQTEEGRALPNGATGYNYEYNLADNLGNVRISFDTGTGNARLVQQDDYLPFGLEINYTSLNPKNEYLYNKKELQEETGIYDYGARGYDPVIARWNVVDPLAEEDRRTTPYGYTFDDPIRHTDPDGMFGQDANNDNGGGDCCSTAGKIVAGTLVAAGVTVGVAAPTIVGEVVAVPVAAVEITGGFLIAGGVGLYGILTHSNNSTTKEPEAAPQSTPDKTHGNKLDDKPAERYTLRDKNTGEVLKHGETTRGEDKNGAGNQQRYSKKDLKEKNADYNKENSGTKKEMHKEQHEEILKHKENNNGQRPALNKSNY
jgi:RHS repeat-associated protein